MKTASAPLIALLNGSNTFIVADLYQFTLSDGTILRYTSTDHPITYSSAVDGTGVGFQRSGGARWTARPQVETMTVTMLVDETVLYGTVPFQKPLAQAAHEGVFDAARMKLYRAFFDTTGALVEALLHFEGTVADITPTSSTIALSVKSELDRLNIQLPRNLFQPQCAHAFLDFGCDPAGTLRTSSTATGALTGAQTASAVRIRAPARPNV